MFDMWIIIIFTIYRLVIEPTVCNACLSLPTQIFNRSSIIETYGEIKYNPSNWIIDGNETSMFGFSGDYLAQLSINAANDVDIINFLQHNEISSNSSLVSLVNGSYLVCSYYYNDNHRFNFYFDLTDDGNYYYGFGFLPKNPCGNDHSFLYPYYVSLNNYVFAVYAQTSSCSSPSLEATIYQREDNIVTSMEYESFDDKIGFLGQNQFAVAVDSINEYFHIAYIGMYNSDQNFFHLSLSILTVDTSLNIRNKQILFDKNNVNSAADTIQKWDNFQLVISNKFLNVILSFCDKLQNQCQIHIYNKTTYKNLYLIHHHNFTISAANEYSSKRKTMSLIEGNTLSTTYILYGIQINNTIYGTLFTLNGVIKFNNFIINDCDEYVDGFSITTHKNIFIISYNVIVENTTFWTIKRFDLQVDKCNNIVYSCIDGSDVEVSNKLNTFIIVLIIASVIGVILWFILCCCCIYKNGGFTSYEKSKDIEMKQPVETELNVVNDENNDDELNKYETPNEQFKREMVAPSAPIMMNDENDKIQEMLPDYDQVDNQVGDVYEQTANMEGETQMDSNMEGQNNGSKYNALRQWFQNEVKLDEFNEEYFHCFVDNGFEKFGNIKTMTDQDLIDIGISKLGHRKAIFRAIQKL
eukprot:280877_1